MSNAAVETVFKLEPSTSLSPKLTVAVEAQRTVVSVRLLPAWAVWEIPLLSCPIDYCSAPPPNCSPMSFFKVSASLSPSPL